MNEIEGSAAELLPNQKSTTEYLAKLPPVDTINITEIASRYRDALVAKGAKGSLIAVGGSVDKQFPRKDIDILMLFDSEKADSQTAETGIERATRDFNATFKPLVSAIAPQEEGFTVIEEIEPAVDEEYQNPNLLKHDGTIAVKKGGGTPIEFIRNSSAGNIQGFAENSRRPWVLLSTA